MSPMLKTLKLIIFKKSKLQLSPDIQFEFYYKFFFLERLIENILTLFVVFLVLSLMIFPSSIQYGVFVNFSIIIFWIFVGFIALISILYLIQRYYSLPTHLNIAISISEILKKRIRAQGKFLNEDDKIELKKLFRNFYSSLNEVKTRDLLPEERDAILDFRKNFKFLRKFILLSDKKTFSKIMPYLRQMSKIFKRNSLSEFTYLYEKFKAKLDKSAYFRKLKESKIKGFFVKIWSFISSDETLTNLNKILKFLYCVFLILLLLFGIYSIIFRGEIPIITQILNFLGIST